MIEKTLLKDGVDLLLAKARITADVKTELYTFIDNISDFYISVKGYLDFNQVSSEDIDFTTKEADRKVVSVSTAPALGELIISNFNLSNIIIKGLSFDIIDQTGVIVQFSKDAGVNWYNVNYFDMCESIVSGTNFWIKIKLPEDYELSKVEIIYKQA